MWRVSLHDFKTGQTLDSFDHLDAITIEVGRNQITTANVTGKLHGSAAQVALDTPHILVQIAIDDPLFFERPEYWTYGEYVYEFDEVSSEYTSAWVGESWVEGSAPSPWKTVAVGRIEDFEEIDSSEGVPSFSFNVIGAAERLGHLIADDETGKGRTEDGLTIDTEDRGRIAATLINNAADQYGMTWVSALPEHQKGNCGELGIEKWGGMKTVLDCISDLAASSSLAGFDYWFEPCLEYDDFTGALILAKFHSAGIIGRDMTSRVVFDRGGDINNVKSATMRRVTANYLNRATHAVSGEPEYLIIAEAVTQMSEMGLWEGVVESDVFDKSLREGLTGLHRDVRSQPQQLYEIVLGRADKAAITSHAAYLPYIDYAVGDLVRFRWIRDGEVRADGVVRIWDISLKVTPGGIDEVTLGLQMN